MKNHCKANPCCGEPYACEVPLPQHRSGLWFHNSDAYRRNADKKHTHWRVTVETSGEHIVSIEPQMLAGREPSEADEDAIRTAAHHLLAFILDPWPQPMASAPTDLNGEEQ